MNLRTRQSGAKQVIFLALTATLDPGDEVIVPCPESEGFKLTPARLRAAGRRSLAAVEPRLADRVLLTNGVSKTYAMTGWRLGYGAGPDELVRAVNTLQSQISSCPSSVSQAAAAAAFTGPQESVAAPHRPVVSTSW